MIKKIICLLPLFLVAFLSSLFAQSDRRIIAVINKADWCPVCQINGEKVMNEVMPVFNETTVQFMMNDLTKENTKEDSKKMLEEKKVFEAVKKIKSTGLILLVDAMTGKLLEKISVAESAEKLIETIRKQSMIEKM